MLSTREMGADAKAEVTREMVEQMLALFDLWGDKADVLTLALRGNGLFVQNPETENFEVLGLTRMSPAMGHLR